MKRLLLHPLGIYVVTALAGGGAGAVILAVDASRWWLLPVLPLSFVAGVAHSRWERRQVPTPEPRRSRARYPDDGMVRMPAEEV